MPIADFTDAEQQLVRQTLLERYGRLVPLQVADAELQLDPLGDSLATCPTLVWEEHGATFVLFKTGESRFRCQFYYSDAEQFATGKEEYDSLGDCVVTLLQVQSDHEREMQGVRSGMNAIDFSKANDGEEYHGPLII